MKKVLFVCDSDHFPKGAMEFIKWLNGIEPLLVKGLFFNALNFMEMLQESYIPINPPYTELLAEEKKMVKNSAGKFIELCKQNNIRYFINENKEVNKEQLIKETRFADLMVLSGELFCTDYLGSQPNIFMKELLHHSECPAISMPEDFKLPERLVIAYDGKKECMNALKQYCSLFPQFSDLPAEFIYIKQDNDEEIPDEGLLKEYVKTHFDSSNILKLHFDAKKYFTTWAETKKNILLITGAFSRSVFSDTFHHSFAQQVIRDHKMPVFISHPS